MLCVLQSMEGEGEQAFSDDEVPDVVDMSDPFFSKEMSAPKKTKKKKKGMLNFLLLFCMFQI